MYLVKTLFPALALLFVSNVVFGQNQIYQFNGQNADDLFGTSVATAGDVNGDGFDDVIVGAPYADNSFLSSGSAYVYSGANGALLYQWDGHSAGDSFGISVSTAGDVNGDGFDDVVIGANLTDNNGANSGSTYVYSGANGSALYQWHGQNANDSFGWSVAGAGDVNGDGFDDVIVGSPYSDNSFSDSGSAYVYSGVNGSVIYQWHGQSADDYFGWSVAAAGDVDSNGFADVIVAAHAADNSFLNSGSAYVYSGVNGSVLYQWDGQNTDDYFGRCVAGAGDVDSDGFDDVIVGAPWADSNGSNSGSAYLYSGASGSLLYQWDGQNADDYFGWSVAAAGNADGDGFDDVIVSALWADSNGYNSGSAYIYSGASASMLSQSDGQSADDRFGWSVAAAGDVNADGFDDVIVGAYYADNNGIYNGSAYVYSGLTNSPPIAVDDNTSMRYDSSTSIDVLLNDSDPDGDALSVISTGTPAHGSASIVNNQVVYTPDTGWSGTDSFAYVIEDANNSTAAATITVEVTRPSYTITNLVAGDYALFQISDAPPNSLIVIGYSLTGAGPINTPLGPADMSYPIRSLASLQSDPSGDASFAPLVPTGASGRSFYTQAKCGHILSDSLALTIL